MELDGAERSYGRPDWCFAVRIGTTGGRNVAMGNRNRGSIGRMGAQSEGTLARNGDTASQKAATGVRSGGPIGRQLLH